MAVKKANYTQVCGQATTACVKEWIVRNIKIIF